MPDTPDKSPNPNGQPQEGADADDVAKDDPHKTKKLTKAGRSMDPDEGSD
ncbi:hypothetical protein [Sphingomonas sp. PB1R3]